MWTRFKKFTCPYLYVAPAGVGLFFVGMFIGYLIPAPSPIQQEIHWAGKDYTYISPLLACTSTDTTSEGDIRKIQDDLKQYISDQKKSGQAQDIGLYFRDLAVDRSVEIDGKLTFSPGSLLKVPIMMSVYKQTETRPGFFDEKVLFATSTKGNTLSQEVPPANPIRIGAEYSVKELVQHMVGSSDNNATILLYNKLGTDAVNNTFTELGLPGPALTGDYGISVHDYAMFFRVLYNSTYLTYRESEDALHTLTKSDFKNGLVAGVPENVEVAHKFGERELESYDQLHDCGIVYAKNHPYLLCVMTRGSNLTNLASVIAGISQIVYNDVTN